MVSSHILTLDGTTLASRNTVRNRFDQDMSVNVHIKQICNLNNISKSRNILSQSDAKKLVQAFITSRINYCNDQVVLMVRYRKNLKFRVPSLNFFCGRLTHLRLSNLQIEAAKVSNQRWRH